MTRLPLQEVFDLALRHHQAGHLPQAEELYRRILAEHPGHAGATHYLGIIASQTGRKEAAVDLIRRAILLNPAYAEAFGNLGSILNDLGRVDEALVAINQAISLKPNYPGAYSNLGNALKAKGRTGEACDAYQRSISIAPNYAEGHNNLGCALQAKGQLDDAIASFRRAIALEPAFPQAHNNLGSALQAKGRLDDAIAAYRHAISLNPNLPGAFNNLGVALIDLGKINEAIEALNRAIALAPQHVEAHINLGVALMELGKAADAIAVYRRAIAFDPKNAKTHYNLGNALREIGQFEDAVAAYQHAIALSPKLAQAHHNLGCALLAMGRLDESIAAARAALQIAPELSNAHSNQILAMYYHPASTRDAIDEELRRWDNNYAQPLRDSTPHANDADPNRRLKIGYVSADFRDHAAAFCLLPLLSNHNHAAFEIHCYANVKRPDAITRQLQSHADHWRDVAYLSDEKLAAQIRADQIDILVDLSMHTSGNRLLAFARKPAPLQLSFVAMPGATGLAAIDYRLTDSYLEPPVESEQFDRERPIRLPGSFWCYDPLTTEPSVQPPPVLKNGFVTFGCLSNPCKFNDALFDLWSRVLGAVPDSRIILRMPPGSMRRWAADRLGVGAHRSRFLDRQPRPQYLQTYNQIDISLDTLPYNGHMTSLDSLWMGTPVVTLVGKTPVGRAGLSQLTTLALPDLIAHTETEFVEIAAALARDLSRTAALRASLRTQLKNSPLMNGPKFAKNVEAAYRQIWQAWCESAQIR
jgi:protein O-GlcNAc transferase